MTHRKKRICILSFSSIARDARVSRQIEYLTPHYDLTAIGGGARPTAFPALNWLPVSLSFPLSQKLLGLLWLMLGKVMPSYYEKWYWRIKRNQQALKIALATPHDAYHANDWQMLPIAAKAAQHHNARLVLDLHEYGPLEWENRLYWRLLYSPMITHILRIYAPEVDASITVAALIAERYQREFGLDPLVVLNAPKQVGDVPIHEVDPHNIRLIHHGAAIRDRYLEKMIQTIALTDNRFSLHFMLKPATPGYINKLRQVADRLAPERVHIHEPVAQKQIIQTIAKYDIGFNLIAPSNYNYLVALPNKFFDGLAAGLAICIGPSPSMAELVRKYDLGCVAPSFEPESIAKMLNQLDVSKLKQMRQAARATAKLFNADVEMTKVIKLYRHLLSEGPPT